MEILFSSGNPTKRSGWVLAIQKTLFEHNVNDHFLNLLLSMVFYHEGKNDSMETQYFEYKNKD